MKTLFKPFIVVVLAAITFTSCMKDDSAEREAEQREAELALKALLADQKTKINTYMLANPGNWQEDDKEERLPMLGENIKRGIWFEVLAEPTPEDDAEYEYELTSGGYDVVHPKVRINYTVSLLDEEGTVVQSGDDKRFDFSSFNVHTSNLYRHIWTYAFYPKSYERNGENVLYYGLTAKGLKKGSHIRVITPSVYAYGANTVETDEGTIPANSPLLYEFEVLEID